jgi:hypothetical protein
MYHERKTVALTDAKQCRTNLNRKTASRFSETVTKFKYTWTTVNDQNLFLAEFKIGLVMFATSLFRPCVFSSGVLKCNKQICFWPSLLVKLGFCH